MSYELTQSFHFGAAHTLAREVEATQAEGSRRLHGHTYIVEVTLTGEPDPATGMVVDLGHLRQAIAGVHDELDHRFLDEVEGLGHATLEGLCTFIAERLHDPRWTLAAVRVRRESGGDACLLRLV